MAHFNRSGGSGHGPQEGTFLAQDEALLLRKAEVGRAFAIGLEPRTVGFVGGEAIERNQPIGDGVGAFMRHPIAEEISAALRDDGEPTPRVVFEGVALKRIELVADEHRDGHGSLRRMASNILPRSLESMLRISPNYACRRTSPVARVAARPDSTTEARPAQPAWRRRDDRRPRGGRAGRRDRSDSATSRRARP